MNEPTWRQNPPRTILLATDLTSRCDRALDRAAMLAKDWSARLVVLHVLDPGEAWLERRESADLPSWRRPPDPAVFARDQIRRDLGGVPPNVEIRVEEGNVAATIGEVARDTGAGLVVTGVARDETLGRYLLGATVDRLVRQSSVPVLVVKRRARPYRDLLVATDFSPSSLHALHAGIAFFPDLPVTLVHAFEVPFAAMLDRQTYRDALEAAQRDTAEAYIAASGLDDARRRKLTVLIEHGPPDRMIRELMQYRNFDLIVVGTHGHGGVFEVLIGSTARRILEASPGDVLLIREPRSIRN